LAVSGPQYPEYEHKARFIADFHRRVEAIPGVVSSGAVGALPMGGGGFYLGRSFVREGEPLPPNGTEYSSMWNVITPGFIKATGLQLIAGRDFNDHDTKDSAPVVIISQTLAKKMFPNEDPLGRVIRSWRDDNKPRQIVGIVADVKVGSLQEQATGTAFVPHQQIRGACLPMSFAPRVIPSNMSPSFGPRSTAWTRTSPSHASAPWRRFARLRSPSRSSTCS
jgi:hypothetical protein